MSAIINKFQATRSERGLQLRVALLDALSPDGECDECGEVFDHEHLEVDHVGGRTWDGRRLNFLDRINKQWREYDRGVRLRALCRECNARDGAKRKGRARYVRIPAAQRAA